MTDRIKKIFAEANITNFNQIDKLSASALSKLLGNFWLDEEVSLVGGNCKNLFRLGFSEQDTKGIFSPFLEDLSSHLILIETNSHAKLFPANEKQGYLLFNAREHGAEFTHIITVLRNIREKADTPFFVDISVKNFIKKSEPYLSVRYYNDGGDGGFNYHFKEATNDVVTDEVEFQWKIKTDYGRSIRYR